jgi:transcriptional regulator with XRE-family HTH domain
MYTRSHRAKTNERRHHAIALRDCGLTVHEVAEVLGITRQAVHYLLRQVVPCSIRCRLCQALIHRGPHSLSGRKNVLCLNCLRRLPKASFGARLRSARLASGLSMRGLSKASEVKVASLSQYERDKKEPTWSNLFRLMCVLGTRFVVTGVKVSGVLAVPMDCIERHAPPGCPGA